MTIFQSTASSKRVHLTARAAGAADRSRLGPRDNVGEVDRWISGAAGAALVVGGLKRDSIGGLALAALGGSLLYRGVTGYCAPYDRLGINTADRRRIGSKGIGDVHRGILVIKSMTVNRPIAEIFSFWRNFENLPRFMKHLEKVEVKDPRHSHWVARVRWGRRWSGG